MTRNRYPSIEKNLYGFYNKTSKARLMEMVRDYVVEASGHGDIKPEAILMLLEKRKKIMWGLDNDR